MKDILFDIARMAPLQPGCVEGQQLILFPNLHSSAGEIARRLQHDFGIRAGDRVVILAERQWRWIPLLFALIRLGAIAVPLNLRLPPRVLRERIRHCDPKLTVCDASFSDVSEGLPQLILGDLGRISVHQSLQPQVEVDLDAPVTLLYSSGSSGNARAVLHSYGNHFFSAQGAQRHFPLRVGDRWLLSLPLYHVGGLAILFRCILAGAAVVIPEAGVEIADVIRSARITHLSLVPTQLKRLLRHPEAAALARQLRCVLLGGAAIPRELVAEARALGFRVFASYGMTETASLVTAVLPGALESVARSSEGSCLQHRELRVAEDGEIWVRGPVLALGRWDAGTVVPLTGEEGWFATGDLGRMEKGHLVVSGRKDSMFISGGENIQPEEIERALLEVTAAETVLVTPVPDAEYGHRPCAWLDLPEAQWQVDLWMPRLRERLPGFMLPVQWRELPPQNGPKVCRNAELKMGMDSPGAFA